MCYTDHARPPASPIVGDALDHGDIQLKASDGNQFMAYAARAAQPSSRGIVILPDTRGLFGFYKELAVRFAEAGFESVALDYFGRTVEGTDRSEAFNWEEQIPKITPEMVALDVRACVEYLRSAEGGDPSAVFTVGFCWGGAASWRQSAEGHDLAGAIGFYGGHPMERVGPWIPKMKAPLLMLLAGVDDTAPEEYEDFATKVRDKGIDVESHTYPGAPHSFFDWMFNQHQAACDDAWLRILHFTGASTHQGEAN